MPIDSPHQGDSFGPLDCYDSVASKLADLAKFQVRAKLFKNGGREVTNESTFSAGEVLALMMQPLPQVRVVGGNTHGCFSDMMEGTLCNDWMFTLSHQRYYNSEGVCFEGQGVPVDVAVQWTEDLSVDDPVLTAALKDFN